MNFVKGFIDLILPKTLQAKLIIIVAVVVLLQITFSGIIFSSLVAEILENQIGDKVLKIAQTVANSPVIIDTLEQGKQRESIQDIAERIRHLTETEFVVVGGADSIRLSHPDPSKIGKKFVGDDEKQVLETGEAYISKSIGTLGPSIRGFAPVIGKTGSIIGFVSVGQLMTKVNEVIFTHQKKPASYVFFMFLIGIISANLIGKYIKRQTLGLEPNEIADLYIERETILESVREGIIAVDILGRIRMINQAAKNYLGIDHQQKAVGEKIDNVIQEEGLKSLLKETTANKDFETVIKGTDMIFNTTPITHNDVVHGVVASFRSKDELDNVIKELSQVKEYTEMLRVQSHEYSNKLHTISGLLQLEDYDEAKDLILQESHKYHELVDFLSKAIPQPRISAIIVGKHNRAQELKVRFEIDKNSSLLKMPDTISQDNITTILGNLIENAFAAVRNKKQDERLVNLRLNDNDDMLSLVVEDSGVGIAPEIAEKVFLKGFTTKKDGSGIGLYLVNSKLQSMNGRIQFRKSQYGGTLFKVSIPI